MKTQTQTTQKAGASQNRVCKHCKRNIVQEPSGLWIDPEATGDDSIWRETCDSHDTFTAEHEPDTEPKASAQPENVRTHKAAEFTNATGENILSFQLLSNDGKAIAIADFRSGKVERFDSTRSNLQQAKDWLQDITACVNNVYSNP